MESCPLGGKENYDQGGFADRPQNDSMLQYNATNEKLAGTKYVSSWSQSENCSC